MKVFSGSSNIPLAEKISEILHIPLSPVEQHIFPDGERRVRVNEDVVEQSTVIIQSANSPVDTNYMELFFLVDSLKRSGAEFVTAVVPYFGYQRQDHVFRDGEAVSLEVIIKILQSVGVDKLISVDMHSVRIPDLFTIPVEHISALPLFAETIKRIVTDDSILISPDMGGIARIKKMAELTELPYAALEKNRDLVSGNITEDGIQQGSIDGKKVAFIVDDMISSGKTIALAAETLVGLGIEKIYVFATHPVFSEEAPNVLQHASIEKVYVTDTVVVPTGKKFEKLITLSIANTITQAIQENH